MKIYKLSPKFNRVHLLEVTFCSSDGAEMMEPDSKADLDHV